MVLSWNLAFFCFIERSPLSSKGEKYSSTPAGGIGGGERGRGGGGAGRGGRGTAHSWADDSEIRG